MTPRANYAHNSPSTFSSITNRRARIAETTLAAGFLSIGWLSVRWQGVLISDMLLLSGVLLVGLIATVEHLLNNYKFLLIVAPGVALLVTGILSGSDRSGLSAGQDAAASLGIALLAVAAGISAGWSHEFFRKILLNSFLISAVVALAQSVTPGDGFGRFDRAVGLSTHPNQLALTSLLGLMLTLAPGALGWVTRASRSPKVVYIACFSMAIVASGSRAAIIGALGGALLLAATMRSLRLILLSLYTGCALWVLTASNLILVSGTYRQFGSDLETSSSLAQSDVARLSKLSTAVDVFNGSPLFGGGGQYLRYAHNLPLQLLSAGGVVLLFSFMPLLFRVLRPPWRVSSPQFPFRVASASWVLFAVFQNAVFVRYIPVILILATWTPSPRRGDSEPARSRKSTVVAHITDGSRSVKDQNLIPPISTERYQQTRSDVVSAPHSQATSRV